MIECKACGHRSGYDIDENKLINDNERFINIIGTFYRESDGYYKAEQKVRLMACPKCGTVIMVD